MYYEPYEEKIRKIAHVRDVIYKFRFFILGAVALITGLVIAFLSVQGSILKDVNMKSSYVYGESFSPSATAFMRDVEYEYCEGGTWTKKKPVMPGGYRVRAKSKNGFGMDIYGKEVNFRIQPAPLTISLEKEITYGEIPDISVTGFVGADHLDEEKLEFEFGGYFDAQPTVTLEKSSFVIIDENKKNITHAYTVDNTLFETGHPITIKPRKVVLVTGSAEKEYDGTVLSNADYHFETALAFEDVADVQCLGEITKVGGVKNEAAATFTDAKGRDVTKYYDVIPNYGELSVLPRAITVTVHSLPDKIYDGKPMENFTWELSSGTLAKGESFSENNHAYTSVQGEWKTAVNVGEYALCMRELTIENKDGVTTDNYAVKTVDGSLCIKPREITLLIDNLPTKEYDGESYGTIQWQVAKDTPLADGQIPSAASFAHATLDGEPVLGRSVGIYTLQMANFGVFDERIGEDVTSNYTWTEKTGTYEVTKRPLSLLVWNERKITETVYDGYTYDPTYEFTSGSLATGDYCSIHVGAMLGNDYVEKVRDVGQYVYALKGFSIASHAEEGDMADNYELSCQCKTLTITKRPFTLQLPNYGVNDYAFKSYNLEISMYGEIAEGEYLDSCQICVIKDGVQIENTGFVRDAGVYKFAFLSSKDSIKICRAEDPTDDTTHNYELTKLDGGVTINRIPLNITVKGSKKVYDAKPFDVDNFTFEITGLVENESYVPALTYKQTAIDAGQYKMQETLAFKEQVYRSDGTDSSMNYIYNVQTEETLVITKRYVTMQIVDKVRPYDGTPLTCNDWYIPEICEMDFVLGHTVVLKTTGSIIEPGKIKNSKAGVEVYEGKKPVTYNYVLTVNDGSLEVIKRAVTLKPVFVTWEYDGKYFNPNADFEIPVRALWTNAEDDTGEYGEPLYKGARLVNAVTTWQENTYMNAALYADALQADKSGRIYEGDTDVTEKYFEVTYGSEYLRITRRIIEIVMHDIWYEEGKLVRSEKDFHIAKGTLVEGHTITEFSFGEETSNSNYLQSITISNENGEVMCYTEFDCNGANVYILGNNNYQIKLKVGGLIMVQTEKDAEQKQTT